MIWIAAEHNSQQDAGMSICQYRKRTAVERGQVTTSATYFTEIQASHEKVITYGMLSESMKRQSSCQGCCWIDR